MPEPGAFIHLLLSRLERISADSSLAHRASGVRGALLRALESTEAGPASSNPDLNVAVDAALDILSRAAAALRSGRLDGR